MAPSKTADKQRLIQLDILRGLAILLVLGRHAPIPWDKAGIFKLPAGLWMRIGWTGVDLFFVLSGFLVGGLLFKELRTRSELDVRRFIIRRGFKIWPSYYLNILVSSLVVLAAVGWDLPRAAKGLLPNYLHVQNYFFTLDNPARGILGHTWSLAVEEHFYLALPLTLLLLTRRKPLSSQAIPAVPKIAVGLIIFCTALRCWLLWRYPFDPAMFGFQTHLRIDSLAFGVLLAYLYHFKPHLLQEVPRYRGHLLLCALACLAPNMLFERLRVPFLSSIGYTLLYFGYGCLLLAIFYTPVGPRGLGRLLGSFPARVIAFIGFYSYTIYLWHILLAVRPMEKLLASGFRLGPASLQWLIVMGMYILLAVSTGVAMGKLVERPALALRDRLFPARADAVSLADRKESHESPAPDNDFRHPSIEGTTNMGAARE